MTLPSPWRAALAVLAIPIGWVLYALARRDRALRERIATGDVLRRQRALPPAALSFVRPALLSVAVVAVAFALSRPQAGTERQTLTGSGSDILIVLDVSNSMRAADVQPDRFRRARYVVAALLDAGGPFDRFGLATFSDVGVYECPLTSDLDVLVDRLIAVRVGELGEGSSDLIEAARLAARQFPDADHPGLVVLLSDGEDHGNDLDDAALAELGRTGARIVCVGIGTRKGARIPIGGFFVDYMRDSSGQIAQTRLEEDTLKARARATGGVYIEAPRGDVADLGQRLVRLARDVPRPGAEKRGEADVGRELFQWPLLLAIVCLAVDAVLAAAPAVGRGWRR